MTTKDVVISMAASAECRLINGEYSIYYMPPGKKHKKKAGSGRTEPQAWESAKAFLKTL